MSDVDGLMSHLRGLDVKLWADGDRLRYDAPQGALTPALRTQLREHKAEILAFLRQASLAASTTLAPIQPVPRDGPLPLSLAQQRLWFVDQLEGESAAYNEATALHFAGPLQVTMLKWAVNEIVRRHEVLRTTFAAVNGQPVQVIAPSLALPVPVVDLGCLSEDGQTTAIKQLATEQARHPFDLARGPLLRVTLLKLSTRDSEHVLLITLHHIISDGWSTQVLIKEWVALYTAFSAGQPSPLPELTIQYADFAVWQREWLSKKMLEGQLAHWRQRLAGAPPLLELPTDKPRPPVLTFKGSSLRFEIDQDLSEQLQALSRQAGTSLFVTLYAAWASLLFCYSAQKDIVIAAPTANRNRKEIEPLIGFFVNTLVLRIDLSGDPTFHEVIERARLVTLEAFAHQDVPPEKLVEALRIPRNLSHAPLAQVAFALQDFTTSSETLADLVVTPLEIDSGTAKTDLSVLIRQDDGKGLQGVVEYSTDLFEPATIARVAQDLRRLLSAIASDPARRLSSLLEASGITTMPLTTPQAEREKAADVYARSNLTRNQYLIWMGQKLQPDVPLYDMADVFTLSGELRPEHFQQAFQALVKSSDALRTVVEEIDGVPQQRVVANVPAAIAYLDFSQVPETEFRAWVHQRLKKPLDFEKRPFDSALIKLADEKYVWFLRCHSIVLDGLSFYLVMVPRVLEFYKRALQGLLEKEVKELHPFRDYVAYEREHRNSPRYAQAEAYWKQKLAQSIEPIKFYGKYPARQTTHVQRVFYELGRERTARLKAVAAQMDVSKTSLSRRLFSVFATLLGAFLYHVGGVRRLSFGTPFHNRRGPFRQTIGMLMEVLPLRVTIERDDTFLSLSKKMAMEVTETLQHSQYAVGNPPQNKSYDVFINYLTYSFPSLPGITITEEWVHSGHGNDSLALQILNETSNESIVLVFDFHCDVFDAGQQDQAIQHFLRVLDAFLADPTQSITKLNLLSAEEEQRVLVAFNQTETLWSEQQTVTQLFEAQAQKTPDRVAVECQGQALTFAFLNVRANQLAHHLQSLGVGPDVPVGLCVERSPDMIVGLLSILKAGGAYVPLDPAYPQERLAFMLRDAAQATCGTAPILLAWTRLATDLSEIENLVTVYLDADWTLTTQEHADAPPVGRSVREATAQDLAYVMYTSGSTGRPKGVMIEHRNLAWYTQVAIAQYKLAPDDRVLQFNTLSFDISVEEIFSCLSCGATLVLRNDEMMGSIPEFLQTCQDWGITWLSLPTAFWHQLATGLAEEPRRLPSSLRLVILGGDKVLPERVLAWRRHAGQHAQLVNTYGPTEATVVATRYDLSGAKEEAADWQAALIGCVVSGAQVYILDPNLRPAPIGIPGELHIGGGGPARGYLNSPGLTAEKFIPHPFPPLHPPPWEGQRGGTRLYKTGDLARYLLDGNIEFLGRVDHQVKIRGFRVELGEVEAVLEQHPALQEAVVLAREDAPGDKRLVAYGVADAEQAPTIGELRDFMLERLPQYMVPSTFVTLEALPLTPSGKVDRVALAAIEQDRSEFAQNFVAPRTPVEEVIANIWAEILGIERVGIHDDFLNLGGHSLLATQVVSRLQNAFRIDLPLRVLFKASTVASLAEYVAAARRAGQDLLPPPIVPIPRDGHPLLSFAQQRLWFIDRLMPNNPLYNTPAAVRLTGRVDVVALRQTFNQIVERHEILRTTFSTVNEQAVQIIAPRLTIALPVVDLRGFAPQERLAQAHQLASEEAQRSFNLAQGPLLRVTLLRLDAEEYVLLLVTHHIVSDGWSAGVLLREVAVLYQAFVNRRPSPLAELPIQYADFGAWQREWLQGQVLDAQLSYWEQQLADAPPLLELPTDRPRPSVPSFQGYRQPFTLSKSLTEALKEFSRRQGCTLFMTLLAAFKTLLYRYSGQRDIIVGSPIANRNREDIEHLIGFFTNTLVLRTDLAGNPTFCELLERVREVTLDAYTHQDLPFEQLVDELQIDRNLSYTPLFQVVFALQNAPLPRLELPDLTLSPVEIEGRTAKFDLTLLMEDTGHGMWGTLEYSTDLFTAETAARMVGHLQTLLESIVATPEGRLTDLVLLTEAERRQLLNWNCGDERYPQDQCVHQLFRVQVEQTPDAIAVVFPAADLDVSLTYRELNRRANQLAHYLKVLGARPESLIGVCVERSLEMVVGLLGILKAGAAYVPLDPTYPQERLTFMLEDIAQTQPDAASILLTQSHLVDKLPEYQGRIVCLDADWESIASSPADAPCCQATPGAPAYVIYTSGSTGTPKGVVVCHSNVGRLFSATQAWFDFDARDVWTLFHSFAFDFSVWELWGALLYGGRVVIVPYYVSRSPEAFYELIQTQQVTVLNQIPSAFRQLMHAEESIGITDGLSLRYVIFGGEALEPGSLRPWFERHGDRHPQLVNMYGITETTVHVTYRPITLVDLEESTGSVIGCAIPDLQLCVLDPLTRQPVPIGVPGELYVGGAGVARGYLRRPALTAERFAPNPFLPPSEAEREGERRLYKTGDLARYLVNGDIEYLGRIDHQVKIRGHRIELGEIEATLVAHPAVQEALVVVKQDLSPDHSGRPLGPSFADKRLVAYVVFTRELAPTTSELRRFLKKKLPDYMLPATFVTLEALPLAPSGKINRRALPEPDTARPDLDEAFMAPRTHQEKVLAKIWASVLGVERVGVHDNFFALGGDSILSIRVLTQTHEQGMDISLQQLFQHQTIHELARGLETTETAAVRVETVPPFSLISERDRTRLPDDVEDAYPIARLQAGMMFHSVYSPDSLLYHNISGIHVQMPFDGQKLEAAIQRLVSRHPVLRTSFDLKNFEQPLQLVHKTVDIPLHIWDLRHLSPTEQETTLVKWLEAEKVQKFDWTQPPLLRFQVHRRSDTTFQFSLTEHHAILDGWSVASMLSEMFQIYFSLLGADVPPLEPPPALAFRDFVAMEQRAIESEENRLYWAEKLQDSSFTQLPHWPIEHQRREMLGIRKQEVPISDGLSDGLHRLAQHAGVPLKSVLLAAHLRVMSLLSGQPGVVTGLVSNGRAEGSDSERVLGLFLNTLPFCMELSGGTWMDLVQRTFASERELLPFRLYPMAELQKLHSGQPLFETAFNFVHFHIYQGLLELQDVNVLGGQAFQATDLSLLANFNIDPDVKQIQLHLDYNADELHGEQVKTIAGYYAKTLVAMVDAPQADYTARSLLSQAEQRQLLVEWNATQVDWSSDKRLHELFDAQVSKIPEAIVAVFEDQSLTYNELNRRANQLAHYLQAMGVGPEVPVGICMKRSLELVIGLLSILKAGGIYLPLDPAYPQERLALILQDTKVALLLTTSGLEARLPPHKCQMICLDTQWNDIAQESEKSPANSTLPENLAYQIYTSGSTGKPKGVSVEQKQLLNRFAWMWNVYPFKAKEVCCQKTTVNFVDSIWELLGPLLQGIRTVIIPDEVLKDPYQLVPTLAAHCVTRIWVVPSMLRTLLDTWPDLENWLPSLKFWVTSGEAFPLQLFQRFQEAMPQSLLINLYGTSEVFDATLYEAGPGRREPSCPIGRPIANVQVYLLDSKLQPVPIGTAGELYVGGVGLARGYLGRPGLTAVKFIPAPFGTELGARLYKTGDAARYLPDSNIAFLGRLDHQVKIRGHRIEPGEIEAALVQHPAVRQAVVLAQDAEHNLDAPSFGLGVGGPDKRLVAYVVTHREQETSVSELRRFLQEKLPEYMVPTAFETLEALPLTPNGKVDRLALPPPEGLRPDLETVYVAPQNEAERIIATLWEQILQIDKVGVLDNFFELGGHSLAILQVHSNLQDKFEQPLTVTDLFKYPTISALAKYLTEKKDPSSLRKQSHTRAEIRTRSMTRQKQLRQRQRTARKPMGAPNE